VDVWLRVKRKPEGLPPHPPFVAPSPRYGFAEDGTDEVEIADYH